MNIKLLISLILLAALDAAFAAPAEKSASNSETAHIEQMIVRFAPTDISADISKLSPNDRRILAKLVEASKIIDGIFLRQVWSGNVSMLLDLSQDQSALGRTRLHYFDINKGPWSRLDEDKPFVLGAPAKPQNAGFYPDDATKEEIEKWIASLPAADQQNAKGFFSVIKRAAAGKGFQIIPYNIEYQPELIAAAKLLRERLGGGDRSNAQEISHFARGRFSLE